MIEGLTAKNVRKEIFTFYIGKCLPLKRFHLGGKLFADDEGDATEVRK
jgi:hypothetical protein